MTTTHISSLFTQPVSHTTDFTALAESCEQLADYCLVLSHLLISGGLAAETERTLTGLLCDLTGYFAGTFNAPRWLRTENGVLSLEMLH